MPSGGQNLKSKAIQTIKRELEFRICASGEKVPVSDINDWCRAMNTLLSIRIIGVSYLRFATKNLAVARTVWKTPKQQEALNAVAALLIKAEERCADRAANRTEKRVLSRVLGIRLRGRPRKEDQIKTPAPIAPVGDTPAASPNLDPWEL
ncbi:MAG: hypothetical protein JWO71_1308 [Candidatus Acidoferrum typicum]|nr:hypothetical protein [Candidatus Acidoferrum typicum]